MFEIYCIYYYAVGVFVGAFVGAFVGSFVGGVGLWVGDLVGCTVGEFVGITFDCWMIKTIERPIDITNNNKINLFIIFFC